MLCYIHDYQKRSDCSLGIREFQYKYKTIKNVLKSCEEQIDRSLSPLTQLFLYEYSHISLNNMKYFICNKVSPEKHLKTFLTFHSEFNTSVITLKNKLDRGFPTHLQLD